MKKKVTLLKAGQSNAWSAFVYPGLALPLLGTVLKNQGYDVKIYVESVRKWDWSRILESDLVGFTVNSGEAKQCYALADEIRARTHVPIVMGGYHVTYMVEEALDHCDYVVRGEGEATLAELADELLHGDGNVEKILGISHRRNGEVIHNPDRPLLPNIDLIPDQSLVEGYAACHRRFLQRFFPTGILVAASRGCPYDCTFCSIIEIFHRAIRFRSHDAVIEDIRQQTRLTGRPYIFFADDNFTAHTKKCKALLRAIIDARLNIKFSAQVRLEFSQDEEFIELMKEAGCYMVFVGFESINPQTLVDFRKRQTVEEMVYCIERLRKAKMHVHGMFVLGGDNDDVNTVRETALFAVQRRLDSVQFAPTYPLPGTQLTDQLRREGRLLLTYNPDIGKYELDYGVGSGEGYGVCNFVMVQTKNINPAVLQIELLSAYEKFYSLRNIISTPLHRFSFHSLIAKIVARHLVRRGRDQIYEHVEWLRRNGFDREWDEFVRLQPPDPAPKLANLAVRS